MIQRILVPLDGSHLAESSLPHAIAIARAFNAEILLFRVVETAIGDPVDSLDWRLNRAEAAAYLEALGKRLDGVPVRTRLADGKAAEQIDRIANDAQIDLIVLTTHAAGGPSEFRVSGTAQKVLSAAGVSVLVVRPGEHQPPLFDPARYQRVLSPLDCSPRGDWALGLGARLARTQQAELWMVHIVSVPEIARRAPATPEAATLAQRVIATDRQVAEAHLRGAAARMSAPDLRVTTRVGLSPHVAETLQELSHREAIDLVVMCAHGLSGSTGQPYGGVAASLLSFCTRPVLVLQDLPRRAFAAQRVTSVGNRLGQLSTSS